MPEIMRQFGQTIIVAVSAAMIVAMMFIFWPNGGSVLDDIGSRASSQLEDRASTGTGTVSFDEHSARSLPKVAAKGSVRQGLEFALADAFTITSSDGGVWSQAEHKFLLAETTQSGQVQIESITSSDGTEHIGGLVGDYYTDMVELSQATGTVKFLESGVYRVRLRVMDHENVDATFTIPLVVDFALPN